MDLQMIWKLGREEGDNDEYVRVGHNTSALNPDAVWAFTAPASYVDEITIDFVWDCGAAGTGFYAQTYDYVFAISADGTDGRFAAKSEQIQKIVHTIEGTSTKKGSFSLTFTGISFVEGAEYYLRANMDGTTYKTMKAFDKAITASYTASTEDGEFAPPKKTLLLETSVKKDDEDDTTDLFMLAGFGGLLLRSEKGETWTSYSNLGTDENLYACHYLGGNYIAVGDRGTILVSKDKGETWTLTQMDTEDALLTVSYGNGLYIIAGGFSIYATSDLEHFETVYTSGEQYGRLETSVYDGEKFIVGGLWGKSVLSYDGYEWDEAQYELHTSRATILQNAMGYVYMGTLSGGIYRSRDGYAWEELRAPNEVDILGIAYGNGTLVICGEEDTLLYSTDGKTLEAGTTAQSGIQWNTVVFGGGKFILAGNDADKNGKKQSSRDGRTWTALADSNNVLSGSCFGLSAYHEELRQKAENAILKYRRIVKFTGEANGNGRPRYKTDYNIGDSCEIYFAGARMRERVVKVRHIMEPTKESITPIFGGDYLNIRQMAKRISRYEE